MSVAIPNLLKWPVSGRCVFSLAAIAFSSVLSAEPVKVAFTGDQSVGENARSVLQLIANEGTDILLIQGDLGYASNAASQWEANLNEILGRDFPVLSLVGNHENFQWPLYQSLTRQRIDRVGNLTCSGNAGVKSNCQFENLEIVQVSPGIHEVDGVLAEDGYADFIRSSFSGSTDRWRICAWHKNQNALQTGSKGDSTGWDVYDACLDAGAMIAVAHEHAYSRTFLLSDFENQTVVHRDNDMTLQSGQSFVAVSGLGGREVREQKRGGDWWASIYTASQGATHGALFCDFDIDTAQCYFKAVDGSVPDQFTLRRNDQSQQESENVAALPENGQQGVSQQRTGFVFSRTDKEEIRWIDSNQNDEIGNIRIDDTCADQLGGPSVYGDWSDLVDIAPAFDSIANPCLDSVAEQRTGYVFSRTDKEELRWIDRNQEGNIGSVWINGVCAEQLGGPAVFGDWSALNDIAPAMDTITSPCQISNESQGFVFSRTDKEEYRWIGEDNSGQTANVWIEKSCADSLGGVSMSGDWADLNSVAPRFDAIESPCE